MPTIQAESYYVQSFNTTLQHYSNELKQLQGLSQYNFPDLDFDTGKPTAPSEYPLADKTYEELVLKLKDDHFKYMNNSLKQNILSFYNRSTAALEKNPKKQAKLKEALNELKNNRVL